jgi:putative chitinase
MTIDRGLFAQECIREGVFFTVEPHYLLAVAQFRSGISDDSTADEIGPFRFKQAEWNANSDDDEFDLHFTAEQINSPTRQCAVFGLMTLRAFEEFETANNRSPSPKELYLQQWPRSVTADFQKAFDDTAALVGPAADAVLDDQGSVTPIASVDQPMSGPAPRVGPEAIPDAPAPAGPPGPALTLAMLKRNWPRAKPSLIQGMVATAGVLGKLGLNTPLRMAHFMGQISEECGSGTQMLESLKYSAAQMMKVFPSRFPTLASTRGFVKNEVPFGDKVYNGRMGNRPGTDDGFNFRGRGCLQLTGRDSYGAIGKSCQLDLIDNPDLAVDPANALLVAATEFVKLGCLADCDRDNVVQVSARINLGHPTNSPGSINGLDERRKQLGIWKQEFGIR